MDNEFESALREIAPLIVEETAFVFADAYSDPPQGPEWEPVGAEVSYHGELQRGILRLWTAPSFARTVAANMLGVEEDDPQGTARASDALGELLNIVLGNVLTHAYGEGPVFRLGIPRILDASLWKASASGDDGFWIMAEGQPVLFQGAEA